MVDCARMSARPARVNVLAGPYIERAAQYRKGPRLAHRRKPTIPARCSYRCGAHVTWCCARPAGWTLNLIERRDELFVALEPHLANLDLSWNFSRARMFCPGPRRCSSTTRTRRRRIPVICALSSERWIAMKPASWPMRVRSSPGAIVIAIGGQCGSPTELTSAGHSVTYECRVRQRAVPTDRSGDHRVGDRRRARALFGRQAAWQPGWHPRSPGLSKPVKA